MLILVAPAYEIRRIMKPREQRHNVLIPARMRTENGWCEVCIGNISSRGMLIKAAPAPPRGTYVEIHRGKHVVVGQVRWIEGRRFGISAQDRIDIRAFIEDPIRARAPGHGTGGTIERRNNARATQAANDARAERSRQIAATVQFGIFVAGGFAASALLANTAYESLQRPMRTIDGRLSGNQNP